MALTVANVGRGNYVLGGLGRVEGPSAAEAMDLAQREEQRFRDAQRQARQTELGMQQTRQQMALAQSQEQRAQAAFQARQAARAQAAARAAQQRAAMGTLMEGLAGVGGAPAAGAAPAGVIAPTAPPGAPRAGLALPTGPSVPLSFGTPAPAPAAPAAPAAAPAAPAAGIPLSMGVTPTGPAGGVQVASLDPQEAFRLAFQTRPDLFGGGVQVADASGAVPRTFPTSYGEVVPLDEVGPSFRPIYEQGLAAGPDPVFTTMGGDPYFVYSDGRVFDILNARYGGDPFDVPDHIQDILRAEVGLTAAPAAPAAPAAAPAAPAAPAAAPAAPAAPAAAPAGALPTGFPTLPDGSPDWAAFEQQLNAAAGATTRPGLVVPDMAQYGTAPLGVDQTTTVDPTASAAMQDLQAFSRRVDINNAATRIGNSALERTFGVADYFLRTPEEGAQRAEARAQGERVRDWYTSDDAQTIFQGNPALLQEAARDPLSFYQQYSGETLAPDTVLPEGVADPASPEAAAAEAPTTAEEAAPTTQPAYGGLQLNFGTPVQLSFGEMGAEGKASSLYVAAPERIFQEAEVVARQSQRLQLLANYYQRTNNLQGLVGVMNQLDELNVEQRYLDGMTAIVGIQQENFGPVQALLQQRYPGRQVEVRPYTDGTVEIFLDGQAEARFTWDDLATNLRGAYDRGFIAEQQTLAERAQEQAAELWTLQTTELLRTQREITVARNQAEIDRLEGSGSIERIGETATGEVIFERVVNGVPIQFVYREVMTRDPITGDEIPALVATPIDQTLVQ